MAQIFTPGAVLWVKVLLLAAALGLTTMAVLWYHYQYAPHAVGLALRQPVPFSHKHHVGDDGIDCRYCHARVEQSAVADIPSTSVCLDCHSQLFTDAPVLKPLHESARTGVALRWARLHKLPDFVYFDHSIHVAKGVACSECHGEVENMPLTRREAPLAMQWCLDCHRHPEGRMLGSPVTLLSERRRTDCSTCHR
jgi:hypothetical protein